METKFDYTATRTIPRKVHDLILAGRGYILVGTKGKAWQAFKTPDHLCLKGSQAWEVIAPNGTSYHLRRDSGGTMAWKNDNETDT